MMTGSWYWWVWRWRCYVTVLSVSAGVPQYIGLQRPRAQECTLSLQCALLSVWDEERTYVQPVWIVRRLVRAPFCTYLRKVLLTDGA